MSAPVAVPRPRPWLAAVESRLIWAGCVACGAGWLYWATARPASLELFTLSQVVGAWLVALPTIREAWWPSPTELDEIHSHRLVSLAVLGSVWSGEYGAAIVTPLVMRLGHWIESRGVPGRAEARESLLRLTAGPVFVVDESDHTVRTAATAERGQLVRVRPGERFTTDGVVEWGVSTADESLLNGESLPRELRPGVQVLAGTTNGAGAVAVRVTATGDQTLAGRMARDFDALLACRPRVLRWLDKFSRWYVPVVGFSATAVWAGSGSASRAAALLVSCCPCALALAGPAAMLAAISAAWRRGIVFRPDGRWESLADVRSVVLDKTGTITCGQLSVVAWRQLDAQLSTSDILAVARRVASCSVHPVALAILRFIQSRDASPNQVSLDKVYESTGEGVAAVDGGRWIRLGKMDWLKAEGVQCRAADLGDVAAHEGPATVLAIDQQCVACFLLADAVRETSRPSLDRLRALGVSRLVMFTGDRAAAAHAAAIVLPLDEVRADCSPQDKCDAVRRERERFGSAAMVGDGANDALAMAASNVGIAIDRAELPVAQGTADVILMRGGLEGLPEAMQLARRSRRLLIINLTLAAGSTAALAALAALGQLPTMTAAVVHNAGAALVLIHSGLFVLRDAYRCEKPANGLDWSCVTDRFHH